MFAFSLARLLGCFAEDVLEHMTMREFREWQFLLTAKPDDLLTAEQAEQQLMHKIGVAK